MKCINMFCGSEIRFENEKMLFNKIFPTLEIFQEICNTWGVVDTFGFEKFKYLFIVFGSSMD